MSESRNLHLQIRMRCRRGDSREEFIKYRRSTRAVLHHYRAYEGKQTPDDVVDAQAPSKNADNEEVRDEKTKKCYMRRNRGIIR